MADEFTYHSPGLESPASRAEEVSPHDTTALTRPSRALYIGTTGDLTVTTVAGDTVTFVAVPAGFLLPIRVTHVLDTGTDADDIVSLS